jgi:hypothetical protein
MDDSSLYLMLGRLEAKLDASLLGQSRLEAKQDEYDTRLKALEDLHTKGQGALFSLRWVYVVIAALVGFYINHIAGVFT